MRSPFPVNDPVDSTKICFIWYYATHNTIYFKVVGGALGRFIGKALTLLPLRSFIPCKNFLYLDERRKLLDEW